MKRLIDLGPAGRAGVEAKVDPERRTIWIPGTDRHWYDVLHHLVPFAGARERRAARWIAGDVMVCGSTLPWTITGHSLGGAVAVLVADYLIRAGVAVERVVVAGGKRAQWRCVVHREAVERVLHVYVNYTDIVPDLPPWRQQWPKERVQMRPFVTQYRGLFVRSARAHHPENYRDVWPRD